MKQLILILFLAAGFVSGADLNRYKESYKKKQASIIKEEQEKIASVNNIYKTLLDKLLVKFMKAGDLDRR